MSATTINVSRQVCGLPQAQRIRSLGITQSSLLYHFFSPALSGSAWAIGTKSDAKILGVDVSIQGTLNGDQWVSAFNTAELGAILAKQISKCYYTKNSHVWKHTEGGVNEAWDTQASCYAARLIYLMESHPIKWNPFLINNRLQNFIS